MSFRTTLLLAGALALLSLAYYLLESREARKEAETRVVAFEEGAVTRLSIQRGERRITVAREEGPWRMQQPVEDRADDREISSLLGNLTRAKIERVLDAATQPLAEFGLDRPAVVLTVHVKEHPQPVMLELGNRAPAGFAVYARRGEESKILLIPATIKTALEKDVSAFRNKAPLTFDRDAAKAVSLRVGPLNLRLERDGTREWRITHPLAAKGDAGKMAGLLNALTQDQVKSFLDQPAQAKRLGLDPPRGEVKLSLEGGRELTLLVGSHKKGEGLYARRAGEPHILLLTEDFAKALPGTVADLRDRTLLALAADQVGRIALQNSKGRMVLKKADDRWRIVEPEEYAADQRAVEDLVWELTRARVKEFVTDKAATLTPYGLDRPAIMIQLWDSADNPLTEASLSKTEKGDGPYARVADSRAVTLAEPRLYDQLAKGVFDFRLRQLLRFEVWDVGTLALSGNDREIVLEKRGEEWALQRPNSGKAKYAAVLAVLDALRNLKWQQIIPDVSTDPSRTGLDKPATTVTLTKTDGKLLGTLLLGKTEGDLVYAKLQETPEVYAVPATLLKSLSMDPATFLE
jgi:hypothetical protein